MSRRRGLPETSRMRHDAHFVEQLVRADELPVGRKIPLHLIETNPDQPRTALGDLSELIRSVANKGVLEPILVRPRDDGRYTIISGERRFRAALEAGLTEIPCIEMEVTDSEILELALVENLQRKDLTPFEEADGYLALKDRHGYTHEQIAEAVGKSRVTVTETLALTHLPDAVKEECRRADIPSKSFLLELTRLRSQAQMLAAVKAWRSGEAASRDLLREARKERREREDKPDEAGRRKLSSLRKTYSLDWTPDDKRYRVTLSLRGRLHGKEEILEAVRDLARRIETGKIDLEKHGRFVKPKPPTKTS